jgi:hypothetical protein
VSVSAVTPWVKVVEFRSATRWGRNRPEVRVVEATNPGVPFMSAARGTPSDRRGQNPVLFDLLIHARELSPLGLGDDAVDCDEQTGNEFSSRLLLEHRKATPPGQVN